jgi:hypothetical protein
MPLPPLVRQLHLSLKRSLNGEAGQWPQRRDDPSSKDGGDQKYMAAGMTDGEPMALAGNLQAAAAGNE